MALHALTHARGYARHRVSAGVAYRLALAAIAQTAVVGRMRISMPMPASFAGFLARRQLPLLVFLSTATLRTRSLGGYLAAVAAELAVYAAMQPAACASQLADSPGSVWYFDACSRGVHGGALRAVAGAGAADALACPAHACRTTLLFFFGAAAVLGAAASGCGGGHARASVAGVAVGVFAAAVAAVVASRLAHCSPLPAWHAALLAAGPPPGTAIQVGGRLRDKARLVADDFAAVVAWAGDVARSVARG